MGYWVSRASQAKQFVQVRGAVPRLGQTPVSTQFEDEQIEISPAEAVEVLMSERLDMT